MLKYLFRSFLLEAKRNKGFLMKGRYCFPYQCSFMYKTMSQFFEILICSQNIWGNVHYVPEINLISKRTLIKAFYLPSKVSLKKSGTSFSRQKTAEDSNAKINISLNIPFTFLLFKASVFLQIFFPRNFLFQQVLKYQFFSLVNV